MVRGASLTKGGVQMREKRGFTLIELIMIIVILGILAAVAIPKYLDLSAQAKTSAEKGVVGGVRAGIMTYFANNKTYPASLDTNGSFSSGNCSNISICFDQVLGQGAITSDWIKNNATSYQGPTGLNYSYNSTSGSFM